MSLNRTLSKNRFWVKEGYPKMVLFYAEAPPIKENAVAIQCLGCGMKSWNENDVKNVYCGSCHKFGSLLT